MGCRLRVAVEGLSDRVDSAGAGLVTVWTVRGQDWVIGAVLKSLLAQTIRSLKMSV